MTPDGRERRAPARERIPPALVAILSLVGLAVGRFATPGNVPLPECLFHRWTGLPCLFCGSTRSFLLAAKGNMAEALAYSWIGPALLLGLFVMLGWGLFRALRPTRDTIPPRAMAILLTLAVLFVLVHWFHRLANALR